MDQKIERWPRILKNVLKKSFARTAAKIRRDGQFQIVMPYARPRIYYLNETAAVLYEAFDGRKTGADLAKAFAAAFPDVPAEEIRGDIGKFILSMIKCRVLRVAK